MCNAARSLGLSAGLHELVKGGKERGDQDLTDGEVRTGVPDRFGPMGGVSGGRLAAAVVTAAPSECAPSSPYPPAELVRRIGAEAEACLRRGSDLLG